MTDFERIDDGESKLRAWRKSRHHLWPDSFGRIPQEVDDYWMRHYGRTQTSCRTSYAAMMWRFERKTPKARERMSQPADGVKNV